jgi:hypothetical protein
VSDHEVPLAGAVGNAGRARLEAEEQWIAGLPADVAIREAR